MPARRARHAAAGRVCERLPAETHAEERLLLGDPAAEQLVLLVEPGVRRLFADIHAAAEDEHGVETLRRRALRRELPLDELVPLRTDDVAEELRPDERAVGECEHAHRLTLATGLRGLFR